MIQDRDSREECVRRRREGDTLQFGLSPGDQREGMVPGEDLRAITRGTRSTDPRSRLTIHPPPVNKYQAHRSPDIGVAGS